MPGKGGHSPPWTGHSSAVPGNGGWRNPLTRQNADRKSEMTTLRGDPQGHQTLSLPLMRQRPGAQPHSQDQDHHRGQDQDQTPPEPDQARRTGGHLAARPKLTQSQRQQADRGRRRSLLGGLTSRSGPDAAAWTSGWPMARPGRACTRSRSSKPARPASAGRPTSARRWTASPSVRLPTSADRPPAVRGPSPARLPAEVIPASAPRRGARRGRLRRPRSGTAMADPLYEWTPELEAWADRPVRAGSHGA